MNRTLPRWRSNVNRVLTNISRYANILHMNLESRCQATGCYEVFFKRVRTQRYCSRQCQISEGQRRRRAKVRKAFKLLAESTKENK
jgi:hypothetical protein